MPADISFTKLNSFNSKSTLKSGDTNYTYFSVPKACKEIGVKHEELPKSAKVLLENMLRFEDGISVKKEDIEFFSTWLNNQMKSHEISFSPARVLLQDFTGVPVLVDLASMRDAAKQIGHDPQEINPLIPADLVIDHSVKVWQYANSNAFNTNASNEMLENRERFEILKWGTSFKNFRVVPPKTAICHQANLEYLAQVAWTKTIGDENFVYCDTLVGTDSHTTMVNGLSVLGWGVGGIEAEAAMLGQPISMLMPEVVGFEIRGSLKEGVTATDLVLTITETLRHTGVVGKFVEFFGEGISQLTLADRATIANMAPEYGATCGFFPIDEETLKYLKTTARPQEQINLVEKYAKEQGLWHNPANELKFSKILTLELSTVEPCLAGPKRPQDRITLSNLKKNFEDTLPILNKNPENSDKSFKVSNTDFSIQNGSIVISAITSCTNTSNPMVMIGAGIIAKNAVEKGLKVQPWVKTSLAPGSKVVTEYLEKSGLQTYLDQLGFNLVGYGCTTCIGNSGPLMEEIEDTINEHELVVASVLSGNRNFEGRIHPFVRANYLASPPLCIAYALTGNINTDLFNEPLGKGSDGEDVYLRDIWPSSQEIAEISNKVITPKMFKEKYNNVFNGDEEWQKISSSNNANYAWNSESTYIKNPPYFDQFDLSETQEISDIKGAHMLLMLGNSTTTDHISPAGAIAKNSSAAIYLEGKKVDSINFNSYGARRGNHEVMMRGTFANVRIKNEMLDNIEGGYTKFKNENNILSVYDAAMKYNQEKIPLVVIAGTEYGSGSSRDWAAKGTKLLGVKAVIAESFERIHRSNLIGMGVLPLEFSNGQNRKNLNLDGTETFDITGINSIHPKSFVKCVIYRNNHIFHEIDLLTRIDTEIELEYYRNQGILHYVLKNIVA